jgi:hypothetical protein
MSISGVVFTIVDIVVIDRLHFLLIVQCVAPSFLDSLYQCVLVSDTCNNKFLSLS